MTKHPLRDGNDYGVTINAAKSEVLLQLDDNEGFQVRVRLDAEEVKVLVEQLQEAANKIEE